MDHRTRFASGTPVFFVLFPDFCIWYLENTAIICSFRGLSSATRTRIEIRTFGTEFNEHLTCRCLALATLRNDGSAKRGSYSEYMGRGKANVHAPTDLYGHIDEQGVRFKNYTEGFEAEQTGGKPYSSTTSQTFFPWPAQVHSTTPARKQELATWSNLTLGVDHTGGLHPCSSR